MSPSPAGVVLSAEEVCRLLTPTTPFRLRMNQCGYGTGLMASFVLTDLPMVLAGDSLFLADPAGESTGCARGGERRGVEERGRVEAGYSSIKITGSCVYCSRHAIAAPGG